MDTIYQLNIRDLRHIGCKEGGIVTAVKGIHIYNDRLYLHLSIRNYSALFFEIEFISFGIIDRKAAKRTAVQEVPVDPVTMYRQIEAVTPRKGTRDIIVLPKITLADDQVLCVEIHEKGGVRHQVFSLTPEDLALAVPFNDKTE